MLHLCAPVDVQLFLAEGGEASSLPAEEWLALAKKLHKANELHWHGFNVYLAGFTAEDAGGSVADFIKQLDKLQKCFHIYWDSGCVNSNLVSDRVLQELRRCSYLGSLVFEFSGSGPLAEESGWSDFLKAVNAGFEVVASVTVGSYSGLHVEAVTDEALEAGAFAVVWERPGPASVEAGEVELLKSVITQVKELQQAGANVTLSYCFPNCVTDSQASGCLAGTVGAVVRADGFLCPCRYSGRQGCLSLKEIDLEAAWSAPAFTQWRKRAQGVCSGCAYCEHCPGGCLLFENDPLIGKKRAEEVTLQEASLEEELYPVPVYNVRQEEFGWLLMRGRQVIPVTWQAGGVLALFDGRHSLGDIEEEFGAGALAFVYSLYLRNFVKLLELEESSAEICS